MTDKLYESEELLNYQRGLIDEINVALSYAKAMAAVAIGADIHDYDIEVIHGFWGGLSLVLEKIDDMQQKLTSTFYQHRPLIAKEEGKRVSN